MIRRPPRSKRTTALVPDPTRFRSQEWQRHVRRREAEPCGRARGGGGDEPQAGGGHDAERSLRAAQQLLEIVTAVVLLERREAIEDRAVGQQDRKSVV